MISENDKNMPLIVCNFTQNEVKGRHLVFSKEEISSEILRVAGLLGDFFSLKSLGTSKISRSLRLSEYINNVVLLINFPEQLKLWFYFKYNFA